MQVSTRSDLVQFFNVENRKDVGLLRYLNYCVSVCVPIVGSSVPRSANQRIASDSNTFSNDRIGFHTWSNENGWLEIEIWQLTQSLLRSRCTFSRFFTRRIVGCRRNQLRYFSWIGDLDVNRPPIRSHDIWENQKLYRRDCHTSCVSLKMSHLASAPLKYLYLHITSSIARDRVAWCGAVCVQQRCAASLRECIRLGMTKPGNYLYAYAMP